MRHNVRGRKLNRTTSHRKMLFRNLVTELFRHERITTTVPKAKEARSLAERLITYAKAGDLNSRRHAAGKLNDAAVLKKLFEEIGPRYNERPGGYTRILRLSGNRKGDNAELAILELVDSKAKPMVQDTQKRKQRRRILKMEEKAAAAIPEEAAAETVAEATEPETTGDEIEPADDDESAETMDESKDKG